MEKELQEKIKKEILLEIMPHLSTIAANQTKIFELMKENTDKTNEMYQLFTSSKGFWSVGGSIFKALILIGGAVGVVVAFIKWLRMGQ